MHQLIFWIGISYRNWQIMCILESFNVINCRLPSFMCDLLKSPIISTFIRKNHICTMWLQFFNALYSIHWELINLSSDLYINICMQNIPYGFFCIILNITPSYFWIIYNYLTSFCVLWKYHLQWFYKSEEINSSLERILIHFEPDDLWFIRCHQHLFC